MAALHRPLFQVAQQILVSIFQQGYLADRSIEWAFKKNRQWGARDRRFVAEVVYDCCRWFRRLNWVVGRPQLGEVPGPYLEFDERMASELIQVALLSSQWSDWPTWLDEFATERKAWQKKLTEKAPSLAIEESLPDWLAERMAQEVGEKWAQVVHSMNSVAPVFLRVNRLRTDKESVIRELKKAAIEVSAVAGVEDALVLKERKNVFTTEVFKKGWFEVQDGGSQCIAPFLKVEPGMRVVDACAGAGGKTLHLAALMKNRGKIIAMDVGGRKLQELRHRASRAGADIIETREIENSKSIKRLFESADALLLDVPCSGSGVWRRNPDSRWRLKPEQLVELQQTQAQILKNYSKILKVDGSLVYATCSIWRSENQAVVEQFLSSVGTQFQLEEELNIWPEAGMFDGFYAARLRRNS